jgi:hypothetical protein
VGSVAKHKLKKVCARRDLDHLMLLQMASADEMKKTAVGASGAKGAIVSACAKRAKEFGSSGSLCVVQ